MEKEEIETFLCACEYGSLSKAAEILYISQATASNRITVLEQKLGYELIYRGKGQRNLEVTPLGLEFMPIAKQLLKLWNDAISLKQIEEKEEIIISSSYSINSILMADFFHAFSMNNKKYSLSIKTYHSKETYNKIDQYLCDIGFCVNYYSEYDSVISLLFYTNKMGFIVHKDHPFAKSHKIDDLDIRKEIYLPYFRNYDAWHNRVFKTKGSPLSTVSTSLMQVEYLLEDDIWFIAPEEIIKILPENFIFIYEDTFKIPDKNIYLIYNKNHRLNKKVQIQYFINEMIKCFKNDPNLMLKEFNIMTK